MNGIEILATQEVVTEFAFNWNAFWIAFGITFGIVILFGIILGLDSNDWGIFFGFILLGTILGLFAGLEFGAVVSSTPTAYETQYKVTISDEVQMNEFLEKYEIIDQEGKIYTIREKSETDK